MGGGAGDAAAMSRTAFAAPGGPKVLNLRPLNLNLNLCSGRPMLLRSNTTRICTPTPTPEPEPERLLLTAELLLGWTLTGGPRVPQKQSPMAPVGRETVKRQRGDGGRNSPRLSGERLVLVVNTFLFCLLNCGRLHLDAVRPQTSFQEKTASKPETKAETRAGSSCS